MSKTLLTRWGLSILFIAVIVMVFRGIQYDPKFQVAEASTDNTFPTDVTLDALHNYPLSMPTEPVNAPSQALYNQPYEAYPSNASQYDDKLTTVSEPTADTSYPSSSMTPYTIDRTIDSDHKKYDDDKYKYDDKYNHDDKKYDEKYKYDEKKYDGKHDEKKKDDDRDDHDD